MVRPVVRPLLLEPLQRLNLLDVRVCVYVRVCVCVCVCMYVVGRLKLRAYVQVWASHYTYPKYSLLWAGQHMHMHVLHLVVNKERVTYGVAPCPIVHVYLICSLFR